MARYDTGQKRKGSRAWRVVFVIALVVLVASLAALGVIAFSYFQGQMKYDKVADDSGFDPNDAVSNVAELHVDWDALRAVNEDTVAWLYVPNSNINYPVVRGSDNEYYLTHDFDGAQGWLANYGAVFMDCRNNPDWSDDAYFMYGHHMNDGSMFADVAAMTDQQRFDECRTMYLLSPSGNFKLRTFALVHAAADDPLVQVAFATPEDMTAYVQDKINRSVVEPGTLPKASKMTKAFALATCDNLYSDGRYVLYAYIEETSAEGLSGDLGITADDGQANGFVNDLMVEE
ncbi:MAG: class B sortase [Eggerthellaceae bacterium]|nr:class B sortase [Eggerthellaceae bacterium]